MKQQDQVDLVRSKIRWGIAGIFVLLFVAAAFVAPRQVNTVIRNINTSTGIGLPQVPERDFQLGLDLQGGAHLVYEANTDAIEEENKADAVEGVKDVIERRINALGVGESSIQTTKVGESFRIIVELPGVDDVNQAIQMIGATPILEFREPNNEPPREITEEELKELEEFNAGQQVRADETLARVLGGEEFDAVATEVSEDEGSKNNGGYLGFVADGDLQFSELTEWASTASNGDITQEPIELDSGFFILQKGEEQDGEKLVTASHILVCYEGATRCDGGAATRDEALARAQELFDQANADNFKDLAFEHSTDRASGEKGGSLGTFSKDQMVEAFAEPVFSEQVGSIFGPIETEFGFHVVYKTDEEATTEHELWTIALSKLQEHDIVPPPQQWKTTGLSGKHLERAEVVTSHQTSEVQVSLLFDGEGSDLFRDLTSRLVGQQIAIFLDGEVISAPTVQVPITNGQAVITGNFTINEAQDLRQRLNAGALPVPIELISQQAIGASLGAESLQKSLKAGIVAVLLVMLFMFLFYRLPGLLSVISLSVYIGVTLALFKLIGVTLTLAGIAGFVLSIGMAVDANVLIFERMREELKLGKSLKAAVEEGFARAWTSIRDGNVSTLITCAILFFVGTSFVRGFAATLGIGILVSMFSAITITRVLLRFVIPWFSNGTRGLFLGAPKAPTEE